MVESIMPQVTIRISRKNTYPSKTVTRFYACECPALKKRMDSKREGRSWRRRAIEDSVFISDRIRLDNRAVKTANESKSY